MHNAYLSIGTNLGDRPYNLLRALTLLINNNPELCAVSSIYETEPVDYTDQPSFLNMVICLKVKNSDPFSLFEMCLGIEEKMGRRRAFPKGPRIIDIDLLLFDDLVIDTERNGIKLTLPHSRMHQRNFVLVPMKEIAPDVVHPVLGYTMSELSFAVKDNSSLNIY